MRARASYRLALPIETKSSHRIPLCGSALPTSPSHMKNSHFLPICIIFQIFKVHSDRRACKCNRLLLKSYFEVKEHLFFKAKLETRRHIAQLNNWGPIVWTLHFYVRNYQQISDFSSKIIRHIMIKTYIIKIQSRNLIQNNRLLAVPKLSFQMIPRNKDP